MHNDQYVFAIGIDDGKYRAYGASPQLTGMDGRGLRDATGKPVVEEIISLAKEKGSGTVDYMWRNPATNAVEQKISLIKRVDDVVLGVGYYTKQFKNTGCALGGRPAWAVVALTLSLPARSSLYSSSVAISPPSSCGYWFNRDSCSF